MRQNMRRSLAAVSVLASAIALTAPAVAQAQKTVRAAMHSDLKILDPIWAPAQIVLDHANLIYDTLFAFDDSLKPQPQMVDTWKVSDDKLTWTFTLRDGLEWHDGQPVTSEDVIPSLKRWGAKDTFGQKLISLVSEWKVIDAKTFSFTLKEPYGLVLDSLGKNWNLVPFIMPKRVAETDSAKQISDSTGSGPFIFKRDEWKPGSKVVYVRNPKYKPRSEPPSGTAGGKVAKVDRVEWIYIPDTQSQVNALIAGEIDYLQAPTYDLLPLLTKDPNIVLEVLSRQGRQYSLRFNAMNKPFDNPKIRKAVTYALTQKDFLESVIGDAKWYQECKSLYPCGTPLESIKGWEDRFDNPAKAAALLKEAGYDGTPVVLLHPTDISSLANLAPVAKAQLEKAGFKVDMQSMDWQTLVARANRRDPLSAGGWNLFATSWPSVGIMNPLTTSFLNASCEKAVMGWPCDAELEKLRDAFARETDPEKQKAIAVAVQMHVAENPTHVQLGQYVSPTAWRKNITGVVKGGWSVFWSMSKD
jgi:peptide/nickel transport system substrate-binding protein